MNNHSKQIALKIFGARMRRTIHAVREDPKKSIRDISPDGRWGLYTPDHKKLIAELISAIHEGLDDDALRATFLDRYVLAEVNLMARALVTGHIDEDQLHDAYEECKSFPDMVDLPERDFYFLVSHILMEYIRKVRESA